MKNYRSISLLFLSLIILTCSKESDVASNAYASSASQNTYTPPTNTTTVTQFTLAVTAAEGGSVSSSGGTYDDGTSLSITATPNEGYEFVGWNGTDMSSSTITIMLTANTTIEALFSQVSTTTTVTQTTTTTTIAPNYYCLKIGGLGQTVRWLNSRDVNWGDSRYLGTPGPGVVVMTLSTWLGKSNQEKTLLAMNEVAVRPIPVAGCSSLDEQLTPVTTTTTTIPPTTTTTTTIPPTTLPNDSPSLGDV